MARRIYPLPAVAALAVWLAPQRGTKWVRFPPGIKTPRRALAMWQERVDLQARFDIATAKGRRMLVRWFLFHGCCESGQGVDADDQRVLAPLHGVFPGLVQRASLPVSWLMREMARRERWSLAELQTGEAQEALLSWYFRQGLNKYALLSLLTEAQAAYLLAGDAAADGAPRLLRWLWQAEPTLHERFAGPDDPNLHAWLRDNGGTLCPILAHPLVDLADPYRRRRPDGSLPFGVNLIGHARGRLGIGEDVRMAVKALTAVNIPFTVCDFAAGDEIAPDDDSIEQHLSEQLPYAVTMFCTTGMETLRAITALGRGMLERRWTIGFWPWELPEWPQIMQHAYDDMDEIWASSRHTYDAYVLSSPVPVRLQPMVVDVTETDGLSRADFGLPEDRFLFAFAYDGLSAATRKNPDACLAAFERAFPNGDEPVGLVIKGLRAAGSPVWETIAARVARDPRIVLVTESLSRARLLDLYRAVDCFVSLHRAEGFGRNIAECMALGKPVIVTAYSGNMDFTTHATAALVPASLRALAPGDYPFGAGQHWAEPDVAAAAAQMQRMVADPVWRAALAKQGAELIATRYSAPAVGEAWAEGLRAMVGVSSRVRMS